MTNGCCIESPYAKNREGGYGAVYFEGKHCNHSRVVYCQDNNLHLEDIKGLQVLHTCDNPACINPAHLKLGTSKDNMQDKVAKGRWTGGKPKKLSDELVAEIRAANGSSTTLAAKYGVSRGTIDNVLNGKSCYKL